MIPAPIPIERFSRLWRHTALATAVASGCFTAILLLALIALHYRPQRALESPPALELAELREQLFRNPGDPELPQRIRELDAAARSLDLRRRWLVDYGGYLLLLGGVVFLASLKITTAQRVRLPAVAPFAVQPARPPQDGAAARLAVAGVGLVVLGAAVALALEPAAPRPWTGAATTAATAPAAPAPAWDEVRRQWPRFRGAEGNGVWRGTAEPRWNVPAGQGLVWKAEVPLPGHSSPIAWGRQVFLTGADKARREVYAFDAESGRLLWTRAVSLPRAGGGQEPDVSEETSFAAPTPATDGRYVAALFTTGELACLSVSGRLVWSRRLNVADNTYGQASSLTIWDNHVLVQLDQGAVEDGKSRLLALDLATGRTAWEAKRPVEGAWSSPVLCAEGPRPQLITVATPWVIAYDPAGGAEVWRAEVAQGEAAPSPVCAGGLVVVANPGSELAVVRADGSGNVTPTHVAWRGGQDVPDIPSPLAADDLLVTVSDAGFVNCYELKTGAVLWSHDLNTGVAASPVLIGGKVYVTDTKGVTTIFALAREHRPAGRCELGEEVHASPAVLGGRVVVRGARHLYCLGAAAATTAPAEAAP